MADLFEGAPESWLKSTGIQAHEALSPDVLKWIHDKSKSALDAGITGAGEGLSKAAAWAGLQNAPMRVHKDYRGVTYNADTGERIGDAPQNDYVTQQQQLLAAQKEKEQYPFGRPEVKLDWQPPKTADEQMASFFGDPNNQLTANTVAAIEAKKQEEARPKLDAVAALKGFFDPNQGLAQPEQR